MVGHNLAIVGLVELSVDLVTAFAAIRFNYLSTDRDRQEWVEAVRMTREILGQPAFEPFDGGEISPGPMVETESEILDWVAKDAETALHPSRTPPPGTDTVGDTANLSFYAPDQGRIGSSSTWVAETRLGCRIHRSRMGL